MHSLHLLWRPGGVFNSSIMHTALREPKCPCFRKNMTAHVEQLPSCQNKNKLRTDEMKWLAQHHVWAKPGYGFHHAPACSLLRHLCFISNILHLFLMLMLSHLHWIPSNSLCHLFREHLEVSWTTCCDTVELTALTPASFPEYEQFRMP